ncbi:MAG: hypothetical protein P8074_26910 [Anaerolineales bacterium]
MRKRLPVLILLSIPVVCLLSVALYFLPPVHSRLAWRLESLRTQVRYALNPPEQVVFVPQQGETTLIQNSAARATMDFNTKQRRPGDHGFYRAGDASGAHPDAYTNHPSY